MLTWQVDTGLPAEIEISFDAFGLGSLQLAQSGKPKWVGRNPTPDGKLNHGLDPGELATFAIVAVGYTGALPVTVAVKQNNSILPAYILGQAVNRRGAGYGSYQFPQPAPFNGEISFDFDVVSL